MAVSDKERSLERMLQKRVSRIFVVAALAMALSLPVYDYRPAQAFSEAKANRAASISSQRFDCGYDPQGARDESNKHWLNELRLSRRNGDGGIITNAALDTRAAVEDVDDVCVVEDDGTIVIPPSAFDLRGSSILFTPDGNGYRISPGKIEFSTDLRFRLRYFYGSDGKLGNADNGYRDIALLGASFPFYGISYDTIYVGTNGDITFTKGDTSARISSTSLASELPRIAPLWGDIE